MRDPALAERRAVDALAGGLSPRLTYHSLEHTVDVVLPAAERLAALEGVNGDALQLVRLAALLHDVGFLETYDRHEEAGADIATAVLHECGFEPCDIEAVRGMILVTRLPQNPRTSLEEIVADADLDVLGRDDFPQQNALLRAELADYRGPVDDCTWYRTQLEFLRSHRYFTRAARDLRDDGKRRNIRYLEERLEGAPIAP